MKSRLPIGLPVIFAILLELATHAGAQSELR